MTEPAMHATCARRRVFFRRKARLQKTPVAGVLSQKASFLVSEASFKGL